MQINMHKTKRIFIVGHMGAFKSTLGKALTEKLGWDYVEANPGLERYFGRTYREMFGEEGEAAFHQCEAEIISTYIKNENVVIVMEEAVIATEQNRKLLSSECVIYLKVSTAVQLERMKLGQPPILPIADWKIFLDKLHDERDSLFEEVATITIEPTFSVEEDVSSILTALNY
jgi:shikimate kinase